MFERIHIIIFLMIFVSCKTNSQQGNINKKTLYSDLDHEHSIPTEKFFSKIEVIPLEKQEKSIIRGIDKIMEYQSCIYILDRRQKAVLIFDGHGKFISKINSIGRAPDEFYLLEDIEINTFRNTLECLDPMGKILTYDLMGNYLSTIYLPHPPMAYHYLHVLNQDSILLYTNPTRDNDYTFRIFSRQQDTIITQFSKQKKIITGECKLPVQIYKERLYFTQAFNNETYQISKDTLLFAYEWNFGKYTYNLSKMKLPDLTTPEEQIKFYNEVMYSPKIPYTFNLNSQNDQYYYCSLFMKNKMLHVFYNKATKETTVFSTTKEKIGIYPFCMDNEKIIGMTDEDLMPIASLIDAKSACITNPKALTDRTENSNPVLVKYYFK